MEARWINLSRPRRFLADMLYFASNIPTVPVQRTMAIADVMHARNAMANRISWPAVFIKAYSRVADEIPALRRAFFDLPWPHLREYPKCVATISIERDYGGEPCVFFGKIDDPANRTLRDIHVQTRSFVDDPVESIRTFRKMLSMSLLPRRLRRFVIWLGLNLPRTRPGQFGTFGLSVYSSLGADSLHPLSPLTTTLTYGVIDAGGNVCVRLIYDHRVLDGATAARALGRLEAELNGAICNELTGMASATRIAA